MSLLKNVWCNKSFFSCNALNSVSLNPVPLKCVSMNIQECRIRPEITIINSNETIFYSHSIKLNNYSGSCNNINDLYAKLCVPDIVKNLNVKVFDSMSQVEQWTNETRYIKWHETCKYNVD